MNAGPGGAVVITGIGTIKFGEGFSTVPVLSQP
jgi:hypothetical protein